MTNFEAAFWCVAIVVGAFAAGLGGTWFHTMMGERRKVRGLEAWQRELIFDVQDLIEARLVVARLEGKLAKLSAELPPDFSYPIFMAARLGYVVERQVLREAQRLGLYAPLDDEPAATANGMSEPPVAAQEANPERPDPFSTEAIGGAVSNGPDSVWQEGKLVPFPSRRP